MVEVLGMGAIRDSIQPRREAHYNGLVVPEHCPRVGCRGQETSLRLALCLGVEAEAFLDNDAGHVQPVVQKHSQVSEARDQEVEGGLKIR